MHPKPLWLEEKMKALNDEIKAAISKLLENFSVVEVSAKANADGENSKWTITVTMKFQ
jgi:hypothetical protein